MQLQENSSPAQNHETAKGNSQPGDSEEIPLELDAVEQVESHPAFAEELEKTHSSKPFWMEILQFIAPLTISAAVFGLSVQQYITSGDDQRQKAMSDYFEQMTELILNEEKFGEFRDKDNESVRLIARAKTLNTLRQLNGERRGQVLKFLYEAELIGLCPKNRTIDPVNSPVQGCDPERYVDLKDAKLDQAEFEQLNIQGIDLAGINLEGASLSEAELPKIGLANAKMQGVRLSGANLRGAFLARANMSKAILDKAQLVGANMQAAHLEDANLNGADLSGANLRKSHLSGAELKNAVLDNANFQEADLRDAKLDDASLKGANLQGAIYNDKTEFSSSFDPERAGMTRQP